MSAHKGATANKSTDDDEFFDGLLAGLGVFNDRDINAAGHHLPRGCGLLPESIAGAIGVLDGRDQLAQLRVDLDGALARDIQKADAVIPIAIAQIRVCREMIGIGHDANVVQRFAGFTFHVGGR